VLLGPSRNDAKAAACTGTDPAAPCPVDDRRINIVFGTVAVDGGARRSRNYRTAPPLEGAPHQAVDQWIFKRCQRRLAA
jgi:hypothetical protein